MRVERILDDGRPTGPVMTKRRWAALVACAAPLVYVAAVVRPARVIAQDAPVPTVQERADDSRVTPARAELERIEAEIAKFRKQHMGRLPEQFQANVAQLGSMQMALGQNSEALSRLQQQRLTLETQLQNLNIQLRYQPAPNPAAQQSSEERIRSLEERLVSMKETLAANHPSVKRLEQELLSAEKARAAIGAYADSQNRQRELDLEAAVNMVKTEMQNLNLQMDGKVKQAVEIQRMITAYQQRVEGSSEIEQRYARLLRERERAQEETVASRLAPTDRKVKIRVTFGADGKPQSMRVIGGLGPKEDEQALEWAKSIRFAPPRGGQEGPREVTVEVPIPAK